MKSDSRRRDSSTAIAVTAASNAKVKKAGIRFHSACAAKKVAKRIAMAAASSALASVGYCRAALSSQTTSSAKATVMPISTRTGGCSQPCCAECLRKKMAAITIAMPATAGNSLAPTRPSQSNDGAVGSGASGGDGGTARGGGTGGATGGFAAAGALEAAGIDTDGVDGVGSIVGRRRDGSRRCRCARARLGAVSRRVALMAFPRAGVALLLVVPCPKTAPRPLAAVRPCRVWQPVAPADPRPG